MMTAPTIFPPTLIMIFGRVNCASRIKLAPKRNAVVSSGAAMAEERSTRVDN